MLGHTNYYHLFFIGLVSVVLSLPTYAQELKVTGNYVNSNIKEILKRSRDTSSG